MGTNMNATLRVVGEMDMYLDLRITRLHRHGETTMRQTAPTRRETHFRSAMLKAHLNFKIFSIMLAFCSFIALNGFAPTRDTDVRHTHTHTHKPEIILCKCWNRVVCIFANIIVAMRVVESPWTMSHQACDTMLWASGRGQVHKTQDERRIY